MPKKRKIARFLSGVGLPTVTTLPSDIERSGVALMKGKMLYISLIDEVDGQVVWWPALSNTQGEVFEVTENTKYWEFTHTLGRYVIAVPYSEAGDVLDVNSMANRIDGELARYTLNVTLKSASIGKLVVFGLLDSLGASSPEAVPLTSTYGSLFLEKTLAEEKIDTDAERVRLTVLSPGDGQAMEYMATAEEAVSYMSDPDPDPEYYQYLQSEVGVLKLSDGSTAQTLEQVAMAVYQTTKNWKKIGANIKRLRRQAKENVTTAFDAGDVEAIRAAAEVDWLQAFV